MLPQVLYPVGLTHTIGQKEAGSPFVSFGWNPPLCPYCASWLEMNVIEGTKDYIAICPNHHGYYISILNKWFNLYPPDKLEHGGDGAFADTFLPDQQRVVFSDF